MTGTEIPTCNMCDQTAVMLDTEYDEYYCDEHARQYQVAQGPHQMVFVTKTGRVMSEEEIERLSQEAEEGYEPPGEEEVEIPPEDMMAWTVTIEVTVQARGAQHAESLGTEMLDYVVSGFDGAAGAVMRVEPNA